METDLVAGKIIFRQNLYGTISIHENFYVVFIVVLVFNNKRLNSNIRYTNYFLINHISLRVHILHCTYKWRKMRTRNQNFIIERSRIARLFGKIL